MRLLRSADVRIKMMRVFVPLSDGADPERIGGFMAEGGAPGCWLVGLPLPPRRRVQIRESLIAALHAAEVVPQFVAIVFPE